MPELPEIQTLANQLHEKISGLILSNFILFHPVILRTPQDSLLACLSGRKISSVSRRGKFLQFGLEGSIHLWFHLGMTGQLIWRERYDGPRGQRGQVLEPVPFVPLVRGAGLTHVHAALEFDRGRLIFRDPRRFGGIYVTNGKPEGVPEGIRSLGPDPMELSAEAFSVLFKKRTGRIKSLLLNQRIMAGLGNIYADESLHRAGIDPRRRPYRLSRERLARLHHAIGETLNEAIEHGGSTIDDYRHTDGGKGDFQKFHRVYGRERKPCGTCSTRIRRVVLAGRSSYFCPKCQK